MNQAFTSEFAAVTGWQQLPDIAGDVILVQADPDNTVNVLVAVVQGGQPSVGHQLLAGFAFSGEYDNADMIWVAPADMVDGVGTAVRVTFTVSGCGPS